MMRETNRKTTSDTPSPWAPLMVERLFQRTPVDAPGTEKDAALKRLGAQLAEMKELEDWTPRTMRSVVPKSDFRRVANLRGLAGDVTCLRVFPGGEIIAGDSRGGLVSWVENHAGQWKSTEIHKLLQSESTHPILQLDVFPDGGIVAGDGSGSIRLFEKNYETRAWDWHCSLRLGTTQPSFIQAIPDGRLFVVHDHKRLHWWHQDICIFKSEFEYTFDEEIKVARATPDGKIILMDATAQMFWFSRSKTGEWSYDGTHSARCNGLRCGEVISSKLIIHGSHDFAVNLTMPESYDDRQFFEYSLYGHRGPITCLSALSDETVVSGSADHEVIVWKWKNQGSQPGERLIGHSGAITCVQLLPDGRVVSGSQDGTMRVWSRQADKKWQSEVLDTLTWSDRLFGGMLPSNATAVVSHLQVLPDGRIISAGAGGRVQVWDGEPIASEQA